MEQIDVFADERLLARCVYCGTGSIETRDHVPSRVLLDRPYPDNLPVVPACDACNQSFSRHEQYVACLLESVVAGTSEPNVIGRNNISRILRENVPLRERLERARFERDGWVIHEIEVDRVRTVLVKLARGHAAYELHEPQDEEPTSLGFMPLVEMTNERLESFEASPASSLWPEIGSRAFIRAARSWPDGRDDNAWITVQAGRYRYQATVTTEGVSVRMVLRDYLAAEVCWRD